MILVSLLAFGCSSSTPAAGDDDGTGDTGGGSPGTGGALADGGKGGTKNDASSGTGGKTGGGGSTGTGGKTGAGGSIGAGGNEQLNPPTYTYPGAAGTAPAASWTNITGSLAGMSSECGNAAAIFASPWEDMLVTGIARSGLYSSKDGGATWTPLSNKPLGRMTVVLFDPTDSKTFWVSLIYGWETPWSEGVFVTKDDGASFTGFANMGPNAQSHNDSVSVDFNDPARSTILSGGHEQKPSDGGVFLSRDGGASFDDIASTLPTDLGFCTNTLVLNSQVLLVGCVSGYKGGNGAIMRSTDTGATWTSVSTKGVNGQPVWASDGSIYWAASGGGMQKSTDQGATFTQVSTTGGIAPIELPDKRLATTSGSNVVVSKDGGATWTTAAGGMPFSPNGLSYSAYRKAFYISHFSCENPVPADAYARYGWDYTTN
jgi:hypothetical protein